MKILAVDCGRFTGYAADHPDDPRRPVCGSIRLPPCDGEDDLGRTFHRFRDELRRIIAFYAPDRVFVEAPMSYGGANQTKGSNQTTVRLLYGFAAIAPALCFELGLTYREGHVSAIRKRFLGHGNLPDAKHRVRSRCAELGWPAANHNEADACALWAYAKTECDRGWSAHLPLFEGQAA